MRSSTAPHNKGLHQTGRGGVALPSLRPVVEARPAGEARCYAGTPKDHQERG